MKRCSILEDRETYQTSGTGGNIVNDNVTPEKSPQEKINDAIQSAAVERYINGLNAQIAAQALIIESAEKALDGAMRHIDFHSVRTKEWSDNTNGQLKEINEILSQIQDHRKKYG